MTVAQVAGHRELHEMIDCLPDEDKDKVFDYIAFLRYLQKQEDAEDRQLILERQDEPTVSFADVKKELGLD
ncbi:MAG: hypothetical protein LBT15_02990 [Synergistaceae bacterium]|jgi:hypothetical protein|nr:hypothetical protein [Synergistaceae bacterium]